MKALFVTVVVVMMTGCSMIVPEENGFSDVPDASPKDSDSTEDTDSETGSDPISHFFELILDPDAGGDTDTDSDTDSDTDTDTDSDTDADTDTDTDSDTDSDTDADTDSDTDTDTDSDTDSDTDTDTDSDSDTDTDADSDSDTGTETETDEVDAGIEDYNWGAACGGDAGPCVELPWETECLDTTVLGADVVSWPAGYCSMECTPPTMCAENVMCIMFTMSPSTGHCVQQCETADDCRTEDGYDCLTLSEAGHDPVWDPQDIYKLCLPPAA